MKIGILTFWNTPDNYGQMLQCFALQTYLREQGHDTFLVRTGREWRPLSGFIPQLKDKIRSANRLRQYPLFLTGKIFSNLYYLFTHFHLKQYIIERGFDSFRKDYLNCSDKIYSLEELMQNPPQADCFIVGSDQIWNTRDGIYFLSWANDSVKKIAYAASFGGLKGEQEFYNLIRLWLQRFDWISVREQSGVDICKASGRNDVQLVCDPTLLLHSEDYKKLVDPNTVCLPKRKYIFVYLLGTRTHIRMKDVYAYAERKNMDVIYVGSQGVVDKFSRIEPIIGEWINYIANAEMIITNSFHGTVFSILFEKRFMNFLVYGAAIRMNDRIKTILCHLGLENRIFNGELNAIENAIDYERVNKILEADRETSGACLLKNV